MEVAEIARHHPVASEPLYLFLGTGIVLGGFPWLDFFLISGWMVAIMVAFTAVLAAPRAAAAWLEGRLGAARCFRRAALVVG